MRIRKPHLRERQIVDWAKAYFRREGRWPSCLSGQVAEAPGETWSGINTALYNGNRGLRSGRTLASFLRQHTEKRARTYKPALRYDQIIDWAVSHFERTGVWPNAGSGRVYGQRESWAAIDASFRIKGRGLLEGGSLSDFLSASVGKRKFRSHRPDLSLREITRWVKNHRARTGRWPSVLSGSIPESPGDNWLGVNNALINGHRGLPAGLTLSKFLQANFDRKPGKQALHFSHRKVLSWAKEYHRRHGKWPTRAQSTVVGAPQGVTWGTVRNALNRDRRERGDGLTLASIINRHRGVSDSGRMPKIDRRTLLRWADAYHEATGKWPSGNTRRWKSIPVSWAAVDEAVRSGRVKGVKAGMRLHGFLTTQRDVPRRRVTAKKLTVGQVLAWARQHHDRTGRWPTTLDGQITGGPKGLSWQKLNFGLRAGRYGLPTREYLGSLLVRHLGIDHARNRPKLTLEKIRTWAVAHHRRTGRWPSPKRRDPVLESKWDNWERIRTALREGGRGLPGGMTFAQALEPVRGSDWLNSRRPPLTLDRILLWARAHARRTGAWPTRYTGRVKDEPSETWWGINEALFMGKRGLPASGTLAVFLKPLRLPRPLPSRGSRTSRYLVKRG